VSVAAEVRAREAPMIFLHGGPGVPDMRGGSEYFGRISRDGFDVYVYDMVGRGRSSRLADPRGYTLERDVTDLEAIHREIGAEKVVLIGHSYGAVLAAAYAASHPERVEKMVLSSPGDPSPSADGASMLFRLSPQEKLGVYRLLLPPRPMLAYALLQVNPEAAHAFVTDAEMDARFDPVYNRTRLALHCQSKPPGPELHGLGFYAHYYPQSAASPPYAEFLSTLTGQDIPTLVIKGRCDYLSWYSVQEYLGALPGAQLLYLDGSGHNAYQDEPERYMAGVRAFLLDRPLPERPYEGSRPPDGYEGSP
jgi:proline iminopeptidase